MTPDYIDLDPRHKNKARESLIHIIQNLIPPPNYRVTLEVDPITERLCLKVLKRKVWAINLFGWKVPVYHQSWDHQDCEQRRLMSRTYENLLAQLEESPEFLEFEYTVEGNKVYKTILEV